VAEELKGKAGSGGNSVGVSPPGEGKEKKPLRTGGEGERLWETLPWEKRPDQLEQKKGTVFFFRKGKGKKRSGANPLGGAAFPGKRKKRRPMEMGSDSCQGVSGRGKGP